MGKNPFREKEILEKKRKECLMVVYGEDTKFYKFFDTSTGKTFVERSVKFEEEPIPDFELAPGDCSSPQSFDDVSDDT